MSVDKVIDLTDRIRARSDAKPINYKLTSQDVYSFLMVLRHLQKRSGSEISSISCSPETLDVALTELSSDSDSDNTMFMDVSRSTRTITFDIPWDILDTDRSELTRLPDGTDVVDGLVDVVHRWCNILKVS